MGRVFEALKRAAVDHSGQADGDDVQPHGNAAAPMPTHDDETANGNGHHVAPLSSPSPSGTLAAESGAHVISPVNFFAAPGAAYSSASAERTEINAAGSALPGGFDSRVAGATADAVGTARAREFPSLEIDPARVEPHLIAITDPRSPHAEQYRSLRTRVLHAGERRKLQAVVITSANVAEGKTVTALNLAWLLAQTDGVRALLVDGDLRQPCAGDYFGINTPTGLSEILAGEATIADSIVCLEPAGLHLLPGGAARDNVAELLSGPKFSRVLAELRTMFDYIIIDAPPLGIFSDASVLINRADGALLVVRSGKTRFATLDRLLEPLPTERILGVVLNGTPDAPGDNTYYTQRRYYRREETAVSAESAAE